jgi:AraC family transcriptional regulator
MLKAGGSRLEYEQRVNRVIDHIREHLGDALTLAALARVAAFSPFHFHRVFTAATGETLFGFIQRLRIEKAATALALHRDVSVLAVALDHGFSSAATFARAFRAHFGMSATEWRAGGAERRRARYLAERNPRKQVRKAGKAGRRVGSHTPRMSIQVTQMPIQHVAYMRYVGPYGPHGIPELWQRFTTWLESRDLLANSVRLGVAHDDPSVTAPEKCRYDACVVVPPDFQPDRWVNVMDVPGGRYAVAEFLGTPREIEGVWDRVFRAWLPASGFEPDDRSCFELYRGNPNVSGKPGTFRCELYLPVRPV